MIEIAFGVALGLFLFVVIASCFKAIARTLFVVAAVLAVAAAFGLALYGFGWLGFAALIVVWGVWGHWYGA